MSVSLKTVKQLLRPPTAAAVHSAQSGFGANAHSPDAFEHKVKILPADCVWQRIRAPDGNRHNRRAKILATGPLEKIRVRICIRFEAAKSGFGVIIS